MTNVTSLAAIAATLLLSTATALAAGGGAGETRMSGGGADIQLRQIKAVACFVAGSPSEFPDDIAIRNKGGALPAGTKISWSVAFSGDSGTYTLPASLGAGASLYVSGVLPGGVEAGHDCVAQVL